MSASPAAGQLRPSVPAQSAGIAPPALTALLDPSALNPATLLQPIQQGVKRRRVKTERALRSLLDQLSDFVGMTGESDAGALNNCRIRRLEKRIDAYRAGEPLRRSFR